MGYRDDSEALKDKVDELSRELAAAQERNQRDAQILADLAQNIRNLSASVNHQGPAIAPPVPPAPVVAPRTGGGAAPLVVAAALGVVLLGGVGAASFLRTSPKASPRVVPSVSTGVSVRDVPSVPLELAAPSAPVRQDPGDVTVLALDGAGFLAAASRSTLLKVDAKTLKVVWSTSIQEPSSSSEKALLVPAGDRLVLLTSKGAFFHDDATGRLLATYLWKRSDFMPEGACIAGKHQLVVSRPFEGITRFDLASGNKVTSGPSCQIDEGPNYCGVGEECGWATFKTNDLECSVYIRAGKDKIMPCDTDDGTRRKLLVAVGPDNKVRWQTVRTESGRPDFLDVSSEVVLIADHDLEAYSVATGQLLWHKERPYGGAIVGGEHSVILATDRTLVALNAADGAEIAHLHE